MAGEAVRVGVGRSTGGQGRERVEGRKKGGVEGKRGTGLVTGWGRREQEGSREEGNMGNSNNEKYFLSSDNCLQLYEILKIHYHI